MHTVLLLADVPEQTLPARSMMAFTLASHIILVPLGVALPLITLVMHGYGLRRGDATALLLARRWSAVMAVQFAIGVVTGTVLSFEFGLLWPGMMGRWGDVFGIGFGVEAWAFFLEAVLIVQRGSPRCGCPWRSPPWASCCAAPASPCASPSDGRPVGPCTVRSSPSPRW